MTSFRDLLLQGYEHIKRGVTWAWDRFSPWFRRHWRMLFVGYLFLAALSNLLLKQYEDCGEALIVAALFYLLFKERDKNEKLEEENNELKAFVKKFGAEVVARHFKKS